MAANPSSSSSTLSTPSPTPTTSNTQPTRPRALGIHHLKFAVSNLPLSLAWYSRVLGARRLPALDHVDNSSGARFAAVCEMPDWGGLCLELRENAIRALEDRGWDAVTLVVRGRKELGRWVEWLGSCGTRHSGVLTGLRGWLVVFEDPDGRRIRIYTLEDHGGREKPSHNEDWLSDA